MSFRETTTCETCYGLTLLKKNYSLHIKSKTHLKNEERGYPRFDSTKTKKYINEPKGVSKHYPQCPVCKKNVNQQMVWCHEKYCNKKFTLSGFDTNFKYVSKEIDGNDIIKQLEKRLVYYRKDK